MCGIVGFFGDGDRGLLEAMNAAILHRGPDDAGFYHQAPVGLAMRRLSIIDLAGGHQPIGNETGRVQIVFNGELYNYRELKAAHLGAHQFATASDTEVVVHLYEQFGEAAFAMLNGMFAFALWDADKARLYLVRDRLGIKPLYYHAGDTRVTFASELKAVLQDPTIGRVLDPQAITSYMTWQYVAGPATMLHGVQKLPPGHFLKLQVGGSVTPVSYWEPRQADTPTATPAEFDQVFHAAVRRQMVADVPLGAFLSGGIDSSLVAAHMAQLAGERVKVFTVGFEDPRLDETPWAAQVARHLDLEHHVLTLNDAALDALPRMVWHLDEPVADRAALPTYHLSRLAREHVKVVLTGEGSDELFGGYPRYRLEQIARAFHRMPGSGQRDMWAAIAKMAPPSARPRLAKVLLSDPVAGVRRRDWVANHQTGGLQRLLAAEFLTVRPPEPDNESLSAQLLLDIRTWLVDNVLMKVDKMTMAASLEARVPFLDHDMVDWALRLPDSAKIRGGVGKWVVKQAALRLLPAEIVHRKKQAFHTPTALWFREARGRHWLSDVLLGSAARNRGMVRADEVERLIKEHQAGQNHDQALWNLLILELWLQQYVDRRPTLDAAALGHG